MICGSVARRREKSASSRLAVAVRASPCVDRGDLRALPRPLDVDRSSPICQGASNWCEGGFPRTVREMLQRRSMARARARMGADRPSACRPWRWWQKVSDVRFLLAGWPPIVSDPRTAVHDLAPVGCDTSRHRAPSSRPVSATRHRRPAASAAPAARARAPMRLTPRAALRRARAPTASVTGPPCSAVIPSAMQTPASGRLREHARHPAPARGGRTHARPADREHGAAARRRAPATRARRSRHAGERDARLATWRSRRSARRWPPSARAHPRPPARTVGARAVQRAHRRTPRRATWRSR